jgi:hypothetical protein
VEKNNLKKERRGEGVKMKKKVGERRRKLKGVVRDTTVLEVG